MPLGPQVLANVGTRQGISSDGSPLAKTDGGTIDWATVAAVSGSDVTLNDGIVIKVGDKYLAPGQVVCVITATGLYGPYDPAAVDGRATLTRGKSFLLNRPAILGDPLADWPEMIYGGNIYIDRVKHSGVATHTLALGPTLAEVLAAFPLLQPVYNG
jgi:hypothetical protein